MEDVLTLYIVNIVPAHCSTSAAVGPLLFSSSFSKSLSVFSTASTDLVGVFSIGGGGFLRAFAKSDGRALLTNVKYVQNSKGVRSNY